jgi:hypothetical protein
MKEFIASPLCSVLLFIAMFAICYLVVKMADAESKARKAGRL